MMGLLSPCITLLTAIQYYTMSNTVIASDFMLMYVHQNKNHITKYSRDKLIHQYHLKYYQYLFIIHKLRQMKSNISMQTLLVQAPYVTIQALFQQQSLQDISTIHRSLQDNIRTEGIGLKKIFESKYMDLINCSKLLEKVNNFATKIDNLATIIQQATLQPKSDNSLMRKNSDKLVQKVQGLVRKNMFTEAIQLCLNDKLKEPILFEVVLLQTVENILHKASLKTNQKFLFDELQAISLFLHNEGDNYLLIDDVEQQYGENISILSKNFKRMKNRQTRTYMLTAINTLFQIKIKESCFEKNNVQFSQFIDDLLNMIHIIENGFDKKTNHQSVQNSKEQLSLQEIKQVYSKNFQKIKNFLSSQMISFNNKKIYFNFNFYNSMLTDNHLLQKFQLLERKLSSTNTISQVLERLWSDFYHQFIAYVLGQLNTFEFVYHEVSGFIQQKLVFPQFRKHLKDNFALNMLISARKYKETVSQLLREVSQLLKLCSEEDKQSLLNHFRSEMKAHCEQNANNFVQLFQSLSDNNQRLKTCIITLTFQTYFIGSVLNLDNNEVMKEIIEDCQIKIQQALKTVLVQYAHNTPFHQNIERVFQDLEEMCMPFIVYLKGKQQKQSFKIFILWLLESIASTLQDRNLEKVNYTLSYLMDKSIISQHEPLFHFIPNILFNAKKQVFNRSFNFEYYQALLKEQESERISLNNRQEVGPRPSNNDLFQIGQKQPSTVTSKITSQKLMKLGSQFVGGLINKIRQPL